MFNHVDFAALELIHLHCSSVKSLPARSSSGADFILTAPDVEPGGGGGKSQHGDSCPSSGAPGSCWGQEGFGGSELPWAALWCSVPLGRLAALFHQVKKHHRNPSFGGFSAAKLQELLGSDPGKGLSQALGAGMTNTGHHQRHTAFLPSHCLLRQPAQSTPTHPFSAF